MLGILLLNIIGFGLLSPAYSNPGFDVTSEAGTTLFTWASIELLAEGAMRCLFSVLFGAGVILFTTGASAKSGWIHYKRTFWLLMFGLFNAYILLWNGDILVTYALAGALLYLARNLSARSLLTLTAALVLLVSAFYGVMSVGMKMAHEAHQEVVAATDESQASAEAINLSNQWTDFISDFELSDEAQARELEARQSSYTSAFAWNARKSTEMITFVVPMFLFWDALMMMTLGMALYKNGTLQGERSNAFYIKLALAGFAVGLTTNSYEINRAIQNHFDVFFTFAQMQPTYHIGRLGMAMGYLGVLVLITRTSVFKWLTGLLASVGRMALTNYLAQSLLCTLIFTGAGLGLVGEVTRPQLYPIVLLIWVFQIASSHWWLKRFVYGPLEWLWRALTYGELPAFKRGERFENTGSV